MCELMIAFEGFCAAFYLLTYLFVTPIINAFWPKIPALHCFIVQAPFIFATEVWNMMPLVIGVERFVSVFFPFWYRVFILQCGKAAAHAFSFKFVVFEASQAYF